MAPGAASDTIEKYGSGLDVRRACRAGLLAAPTAGLAQGFQQGNVVILPAALADDFHRLYQADPVAIKRPTLVPQEFHGEDHIFWPDRLAIGKAGGWIEREFHERTILVGFDALGDQRVEREGFVSRPRHQRLENVEAEKLVEQSASAVTLHDEGVQAVEGAGYGIVDAAALGCIWVHIGEMREIRGQVGLSMHRDGVRRFAEDRHG